MKLHRVKECLNVHDSDISGSIYDDVNMSGSTIGNVNLAGCSFRRVNLAGATFEDSNLSGWKLHDVNLAGLKIVQANLAGASIAGGRMEGMTIDGILVTELPRAYRASRPTGRQSPRVKIGRFSSHPRLPARSPDLRRRGRHVEARAGAGDGVGNRVHDRRERSGGAGLADALDTQRISSRRH